MIPLGVLGSAHVPAAGGTFDPISGVGWQHAYWAEGPEFTALGYSDTDGVSSWPDEVGSVDFTQGTSGKRPLYRAASSNMNGKPAVDPDATDDDMLSSAMTITNTSVVYIGTVTSVWNSHTIVQATAFPQLSINAPGGNRNLTMGTGSTAFASADNVYSGTGRRLLTFVYLGASSVIQINGSTVATGNAGTGAVSADTMRLFSRGSDRWHQGPASFLGFYAGDVRSDPGWSDFVAWAFDHYDI